MFYGIRQGATHVITIRNVHTSFGGKTVYKDLNLKIKSDRFLAIIGRSGCGKSVLLKYILALMMPDKGEIWVDGLCVNKASEKDLNQMRRHCGMVFQTAALFDSLTVAENVAFAFHQDTSLTPSQKRSMAREKLKWVGLEQSIDQFPSELSGGMRKRVAIARAIATNPRVILYDEPTTGLDPITSDKINRLMRELHERIEGISIVVTHDMKSAYAVCDEIAMIYNGQVIVHDTIEEMRKQKNPYVKQFLKGCSEGPIGVDAL